MTYQTLISAKALQTLLAQEQAVVLLDCGFDLAQPDAGARAFDAGHIAGAHYAHLDKDLAGAKTGSNGRHPLPERDALRQRAGQWGISPGVQVVAYDDQGLPYAARAWWLLRWLGHADVAVLDGGRAAWLAASGQLTAEVSRAAPAAPYPAQAALMPTVDAAALLAQMGRWRVLDARAPERFRGDVEPLDPVAGHIPGANNRFFRANLDTQGQFKSAELLRAEFAALGMDAHSASSAVQQCGSGVTACHNLLAMAHAGLGETALYPGSWSEWCSDASRPVARG
jgi:thiosulfate/3-mercaptopyruvate sulfurtransferase